MSLRKIRLSLILMGGLLAVFVLFSFVPTLSRTLDTIGVLAQEIDKERAIEIVITQGGPGECNSESSCRSFCDNPNNFETCINWARENGLISSEDAQRAERLSKVGREFSGPGGCRSHEECERFCSQPQNQEVCLDFAVRQGFLTPEEAQRIKEFRRQAEEAREEFEVEIETDPEFDKDRAQQILETQGGPGGCQTMEECEEFCDQPQNQQVCFEFAERHGLFKNHEAVEKIRKIIEEGGPGGCRGERQCRAFCENPDNFETCIEFAQKHEFIKPEEVEKAKRGARALREGGPGGCRGPKECQAFCSDASHQEICFEWAKSHGFVSEEQIRMMEEFRQRRQEIELEHRKRGEEFRPPEGFQPTGGEPPGFGGTPPPEAEHIRACFEKGGNWTGSSCEFPGKGEICPKLPTVDSCPLGYRKEVAFSSPECGIYYQCVPEGGFPSPEYTQPPEYTPLPEYSPQPTYQPYYEDPATRCAKEGGIWNFDTKTCVFEKSTQILQNTGAYIKGAFREFFR